MALMPEGKDAGQGRALKVADGLFEDALLRQPVGAVGHAPVFAATGALKVGVGIKIHGGAAIQFRVHGSGRRKTQIRVLHETGACFHEYPPAPGADALRGPRKTLVNVFRGAGRTAPTSNSAVNTSHIRRMISGEKRYIWQQDDWPHLAYDLKRLVPLLSQVHLAQGHRSLIAKKVGRKMTLEGREEEAEIPEAVSPLPPSLRLVFSASPAVCSGSAPKYRRGRLRRRSRSRCIFHRCRPWRTRPPAGPLC
jgi:hypothetical protein